MCSASSHGPLMSTPPPCSPPAGTWTPAQRGSLMCSASSHGPLMSTPPTCAPPAGTWTPAQRGSLTCSASSHGPLISTVPSGDGVGLGEELGVGLGEELADTRTSLLVGVSACFADSGPLARARAAIATRNTATAL